LKRVVAVGRSGGKEGGAASTPKKHHAVGSRPAVPSGPAAEPGLVQRKKHPTPGADELAALGVQLEREKAMAALEGRASRFGAEEERGEFGRRSPHRGNGPWGPGRL
jgi:hypothetical protein